MKAKSRILAGPEQIVFRDLKMVRQWCKMPYPGHRKGCPNAEGCKFFRDDLQQLLANAFKISLVWVEFDLNEQEQRMRDRQPSWTTRQCRNLLYWQNKVRKEPRWWAKYLWPEGKLLVGAEGGGVDFYTTMRRLGVPLDPMRDLHTVRVIGIVYEDGLKQPDLFDYRNGGY